MFNLQIRWTDGSISSEQLGHMKKDDPVSCAIYGKEHNLLDLPVWKRFKNIVSNEKKTPRMIHQANLRLFRQPQSLNWANKSHGTIKRPSD